MNFEDFKLWRSPVICRILSGFFAALTILWQFVDAKPYPHRYRDWVAGTVIFAGAAIVFFVLACRAGNRTKRD